MHRPHRIDTFSYSSCINANDTPTDTDPAPKSHVADHNSDAVAVNVPDDRGRKATAHLDRMVLSDDVALAFVRRVWMVSLVGQPLSEENGDGDGDGKEEGS